MILKKPYAFLIKNFKLIHVILTTLYVYLAFKVSSILNFYNSFIKGTTGKINAINYISNIPYIVILISIIVCLILFILMNYKKKPKFLYFILITLYIVVFAIIFITSNGLNTIYNNVLDTKTALLYRDFLRIIICFQYASIILTTIRAIGFDIKKFNFSEDINDLNIEVTDDEEVELVMGIDNHKLTQKYNRKLREFKYYIKENKIFVIVLVAVIILLSLSTITINKTVVNKEYNQNETFSSDNFKMQITNSYITANASDGTNISPTSSFLIIKLYIEPKKTKMSLNTSNLTLRINNDTFTSNKKYCSYFKDLGTCYSAQLISSAKQYVLIYKLPNEIIDNKMYISYFGSAKEIKINLTPKYLDNTTKSKEYNLTEEIQLNNAVLTESTIKINSYELNNKFSYNYTYSINNQDYEGKKYITSAANTILFLNISSNYNTNITDFELISNYGKIKYIKDGVEYTSKKINDKTPANYNNGVYLEVDKDIDSADNIWLELNIRDASYKYTIK